MAQALATRALLAKTTVVGKSAFGGNTKALVARAAKPAAVRSVALNVVARDAPWCPGTEAPSYLDGSLPGDFGFDPLGLGKDPAMLAQFREAEVIHARWCMLAIAGMLTTEILGIGNWIEVPLDMANGKDSLYLGQNLGPAMVWSTLAVEGLLMGVAEGRRAGASDPEARIYPGGAFDPMGMSKGNLDELKLKEIKNGRLAMVAVFGVYMQSAVTGEGPVANWYAFRIPPLQSTRHAVHLTKPLALLRFRAGGARTSKPIQTLSLRTYT